MSWTIREGRVDELDRLVALRRALLSHVIRVLRTEGVPVASLHASSGGRRLYKELGFKVKDELPEMRILL